MKHYASQYINIQNRRVCVLFFICFGFLLKTKLGALEKCNKASC